LEAKTLSQDLYKRRSLGDIGTELSKVLKTKIKEKIKNYTQLNLEQSRVSK